MAEALVRPPVPAHAEAGSEAVIRILGLYTSNLVELRGSAEAAETEFVNLVAFNNQVHMDSGTIARFEIAGLRETNYPAAAHNNSVLRDVSSNTMPDGLDIDGIRADLEADLVALIRPHASGDWTCGMANLVGSGLAPDAYDEFTGNSVSNVGACGSLTFVHELGHNLGSTHAMEQEVRSDGSIGYGAFPFSFGHRQAGPPAFATVMAYVLQGQVSVPRFSNPLDNQCLGAPCGVEGTSNNVESINLMAGRVSRLRDPLNTISIWDARVLESDNVDSPAVLRFAVRLSSPAPAGGVRFDVATVEGGSATPGIDFIEAALPGKEIPEGARETTIDVVVHSDMLVEDDETVVVRLSNAHGADIFDGEGVGVIWDDDPRVTLKGRLVFPDGAALPESGLQVYASTWWGGGHDWEAQRRGNVDFQSTIASPPHFDFELGIHQGDRVVVSAALPDGFVMRDHDLGVVSEDQTHDLVVMKPVRVSGQVRWEEEHGPPQSAFDLILWGYLGDSAGMGLVVSPPDFSFSADVLPGSAIAIDAYDPPAPYVRQRLELGVIESDTVKDIQLRTVPSLTADTAVVQEGGAGESRGIDVKVRLSSVAPPGGISFTLDTIDGSAKSGADYVGIVGQTHTIGEGNNTFVVELEVLGDDVPEDDEDFAVLLSSSGEHVWIPGEGTSRVLIRDDDARRAGDGTCSGSTTWPSVRMCEQPSSRASVLDPDSG